MHRENKISEQLACRLLYKEQLIENINLTQVYMELTQFIQNSSKLTIADQTLYCYFNNGIEKKCKVGVHVIGWDTQVVASEYRTTDFNHLKFDRIPFKIDSNNSLSKQILENYHQNKVNLEDPFRFTCDFLISEGGFKIETYLDFFSLIK